MNDIDKQISFDWDKIPCNPRMAGYKTHPYPCYAICKEEDVFPYFWESFCEEFPKFKNFSSLDLMFRTMKFAMDFKYNEFQSQYKMQCKHNLDKTKIYISFREMMFGLWHQLRLTPLDKNVQNIEDAYIIKEHIDLLIPESIGKLNSLDAINSHIYRLEAQKKVA